MPPSLTSTQQGKLHTVHEKHWSVNKAIKVYALLYDYSIHPPRGKVKLMSTNYRQHLLEVKLKVLRLGLPEVRISVLEVPCEAAATPNKLTTKACRTPHATRDTTGPLHSYIDRENMYL